MKIIVRLSRRSDHFGTRGEKYASVQFLPVWPPEGDRVHPNSAVWPHAKPTGAVELSFIGAYFANMEDGEYELELRKVQR